MLETIEFKKAPDFIERDAQRKVHIDDVAAEASDAGRHYASPVEGMPRTLRVFAVHQL
jgi:hypothetical protein|tara:strand:+ start:9429 stop:9602 length:174 start_codon:yes stop_codon:yes gene_type:complete